MVAWRALGLGLLAFVVTVVVALTTAPPWLLLAGVPPGLVVGAVVGRAIGGLLYGAVVGLLAGASLLAGADALVAQAERVAPGVGLSLAAVAVLGAFVAAQCAVAGAVAGFLRR